MKAPLFWVLATALTLGGISQSITAEKKKTPDRERFIGSWHLVSLGDVGPGGKLNNDVGLLGTLIYTRDGHMSVQIMYPPAASSLSNDYVLNGYEASFGSYEVDEAKHTITHHVQGSITHGLVGKKLPRVYQLTDDGHLIIKSIRPDEHWQVVWEHD
ncbi:MAG TPA: lipocalin-like domain-containing protein [Terracidiphilus sp.]|jgi:hypothetical protein